LDNGANIHAKNDWALREASRWGHTKIVKLLQNQRISTSGFWSLDTLKLINKKLFDFLFKCGELSLVFLKIYQFSKITSG